MTHTDIGVLRNAQLIMLNLLREFHEICEKNNLTYWLDSGTLLGAVRHGGFIPWDDDLDVCMPREDYEVFLKVAAGALPKSMFLQSRDTDCYYNAWWAKIRDRNSVLQEQGIGGLGLHHQGIYIDIFPMDKLPGSYGKRKFLQFINKKLANICNKLERYYYGHYKKPLLSPRNICKNASRLVVKRLLGSSVTGVRKVSDRLEKAMVRYALAKAKRMDDYLYGYGLGQSWRQTFSPQILFPLKTILFEGDSFYAPGNFDGYLKNLYGDTYMTLPPEKDRVQHSQFIKIDLSPEESEISNQGCVSS